MIHISVYPICTCAYVKRMTKEDELELRDSYKVKSSVEGARFGNNEKKKENYYRLVNGCPIADEEITHRRKEELTDSGLVLLDFDQKDSKDNHYTNVIRLFKKHIADWGVVHMERSARNGAHITVRRIEGLSIEQTIRLFELRTGLTIDHCHDLTRACFLVPNDYVYFVDEAAYYSDSPVEPMPLSESEQELLCEDARKQEKARQEHLNHLRANAQRYRSTGDEAEDVRRICNLIYEAGIDITYDYNNWYRLGFVIARYLGTEGYPYFDRLSSLCPSKYDPNDTRRKYDALCSSVTDDLSLGTLIYFAREHGVMA